MSKQIGKVTILTEEPENICHMCGKIAETRPYGPGFQEICWKCSQKDPKGTEKRTAHKLFGESINPEEIGTI